MILVFLRGLLILKKLLMLIVLWILMLLYSLMIIFQRIISYICILIIYRLRLVLKKILWKRIFFLWSGFSRWLSVSFYWLIFGLLIFLFRLIFLWIVVVVTRKWIVNITEQFIFVTYIILKNEIWVIIRKLRNI